MEMQTRPPLSIFQALDEDDDPDQGHIPLLSISSPPRMLTPLQRTTSCNLQTNTTTPSPRPLEDAEEEELADGDDGSVASRLLGAIGKSISSPSLTSCCKEVVQETPYQKSLKLKRMQLHHCTEELGSESCTSSCSAAFLDDTPDSSPTTPFVSNQNCGLKFAPISCLPTRALPWSPDHGMLRKRSFLTLLNYISQNNRYQRADVTNRLANFPPPLDILMSSVSSSAASSAITVHAVTNQNDNANDGNGVFMVTLRSCKQDGRFVLKETKMPLGLAACLKPSRSDNRLTLRLNLPIRIAESATSYLDAQLGTRSINFRSSELRLAVMAAGTNGAGVVDGAYHPLEGGEGLEETQAGLSGIVPGSSPGTVTDFGLTPVITVDLQSTSAIAAAAKRSYSADPQSNSSRQPSQLDQDEAAEISSKGIEYTRAEHSLSFLLNGGEGNGLRCTSDCSSNKKGSMQAMHYHRLHTRVKIRCVATTS